MKNIAIYAVISFLIFGCNSKTTQEDTDLIIISQDTVDSGDSVPISIKYPKTINTNDELVIRNNNAIIASFRFLDGFKTDLISLRTRMMSSGTIEATLLRNNKVIENTNKYITVNSPADIPETARIDMRHKYRIEDNSLKLIFVNGQSKSHYITNIDIVTNAGRVIILPTVLISKNPYFSIRSLNSLNQNDIRITSNVLQDEDDIQRYKVIIESFGAQCKSIEYDIINLEKSSTIYSNNISTKNNDTASEDAFLMQKRLKEIRYNLKDLCTSKDNFSNNADLFGRSASSFGTILKRRLISERASPLDESTATSIARSFITISDKIEKLLAITPEYMDSIIALDSINKLNNEH